MERITNKAIEHYQRLLNKALGRPLDHWDKETRTFKPGHIKHKGINGHWNIYCLRNKGGGDTGLAYGLTKREVYAWYRTTVEGIDMFKDSKNYEVCAK